MRTRDPEAARAESEKRYNAFIQKQAKERDWDPKDADVEIPGDEVVGEDI